MSRKIPQTIFWPAVLVLAVFALSIRADQQPSIKKVPARPIDSLAGKDLFRQYCAVCHGTSAKGDGPAAVALKVKPADLTQISRKNGNKYPEIHVQRVINGEDSVEAHGSREMPVWGPIFRQFSANRDLGAVRVYNLVTYIAQIQAK